MPTVPEHSSGTKFLKPQSPNRSARSRTKRVRSGSVPSIKGLVDYECDDIPISSPAGPQGVHTVVTQSTEKYRNMPSQSLPSSTDTDKSAPQRQSRARHPSSS
mgnify:CR=1 FL=1